MKVFIVEEGEYSDRCVVGVFSSEEKAEHYCEKINQGADWTEVEVDEEIKPEYWFNVGIALFTGRIFYCNHTEYEKEKGITEHGISWYNRYKEVYINVTTPARDRDHAIKIAADKRREWIATKNIRDAVK